MPPAGQDGDLIKLLPILTEFLAFQVLTAGMFMMNDLFRLSDEVWHAIAPHLPKNQPGAPRVDEQRIICGVLHVLKVGCRWRNVQAEYCPAKTVYNRYHRWARRRIWRRLFERMPPTARSRMSSQSIARRSKRIVLHKAQKGARAQAIGTLRGGRTSKMNCLADDRGRPAAFSLTPGNVADIKMATPLLEVALS